MARYLSGGNTKDINATELENYKKAGIAVIFVWETTGTDMVSHAAGVADATIAQAELERLAAALKDPSVAKAPVFFAADEAAEPDMPDYVKGAASVIGKDRTGIYGGYGSVHAAFNDGLVAYGWQTLAWSAGQWDDRALLRQVQNNVKVGPATVDIDQAAYWASTAKTLGIHDDFGQWPRPSAPAPVPAYGPWGEWVVGGNLSVKDEAGRAGVPVSTWLRLQVEHLDGFVPGMSKYLEGCDLTKPIPAGTRIWSRVAS